MLVYSASIALGGATIKAACSSPNRRSLPSSFWSILSSNKHAGYLGHLDWCGPDSGVFIWKLIVVALSVVPSRRLDDSPPRCEGVKLVVGQIAYQLTTAPDGESSSFEFNGKPADAQLGGQYAITGCLRRTAFVALVWITPDLPVSIADISHHL